MLRKLINGFWWAFALDGLASLLRDTGMLGSIFAPLGHLFPALALWLSVPIIIALIATPRAPKRILLPMVLFIWWGGFCAAFPMVLLEDFSAAPLWLSAAQCALAAGLNLTFRARGASWVWPFEENAAPFFRLRSLLISGAVGLVLGSVLILMMLGSSAVIGIAEYTDGYVRLRADGVYITERRFQSGDREVRLVGMMHVAKKEFYSGVLPQETPSENAVVLLEGVTDHKRLLDGSKNLGYEKLAGWMGVAAQEESPFTQQAREGLERGDNGLLDFRHADVDVETFHPKTLATIGELMSFMNAKDWSEAMKHSSVLYDNDASEQVMQDILHARNKNLTKEIQSALQDYRTVIVAWGALHMPEIEAWLKENHFKQSAQIERKALGFW